MLSKKIFIQKLKQLVGQTICNGEFTILEVGSDNRGDFCRVLRNNSKSKTKKKVRINVDVLYCAYKKGVTRWSDLYATFITCPCAIKAVLAILKEIRKMETSSATSTDGENNEITWY